MSINIYHIDMAAIYLDNLIKPRQANSDSTLINKEPGYQKFTYSDLHLDLQFASNIGSGRNVVSDKDVMIDKDAKAIRNSIINIFTCRPGNKVLTPEFGSNLDRYLFEAVTTFKANLIGNTILKGLSYEPRIVVEKVYVTPMYNDNQYHVSILYHIFDTKIADKLDIRLKNQNNTGTNFVIYGQ